MNLKSLLLPLVFPFLAFAAQGATTAGGRVLLSDSIREVPAAGAALAAGPEQAALVRSTLSAAENGETMEFEVALAMRNFPELQQRLDRGERIAAAEMAARYFPLETDYETVADWLASQGLTITLRDPSRLAIFASGPVSQVGQAFQTAFARVSFENAEYTSAISAPSVPAALAPAILGVNGLQPHIRPHKHVRLLSMQPAASIAPPFQPGEIAYAYNANGLSETGAGQEIAIVIDTFPNTSDLTTFWSDCGVSQSLSNIEFVQVVSGTLPAPSGEETLDTEWSSAIAPGAKVRVYAVKDLASIYIDEGYQQIYSDLPSQPGLHEVSLSYGLGETYTTITQVRTDDQYFAELASAGVTVFVSSGDGGSSPGTAGQNTNGQSVQVETPASDPNVTGVGGTSLEVNSSTGNVTSETAWSDSGGGISIYFTRPSWQTGTGVPSGSDRLVPDVAAVADPSTGGFLILNGAEYEVGGTSWSAPTWAGFGALINQARAAAGLSSLGLLNSQIYPLIGSADFRDITTGSNGPDGVYNAGVGYDLCTGIGVPDVANLLQTLVPAPVPVMPSPARALLVLLLFATALWFIRRCMRGNAQHRTAK